MLELQNVCFSVKEKGKVKDILKNINLKIDEDKFFVVTGPNGSGKSTLAKSSWESTSQLLEKFCLTVKTSQIFQSQKEQNLESVSLFNNLLDLKESLLSE